MASVTMRRVEKIYERQKVIHGIDVDVADEEFVVLVGPSGCGKSTLLRMVAGLEAITGGEILIAGERVNDMAPKDRDVAMVFQNYALYPHKTVRENMAFSLKLRRTPKAEIATRVERAATVLGLAPYLERYPKQLSGGQRQRVAMGRAIVRDPRVFLFDEPLSNLDAQLRVQMRTEIKELHEKLRTTSIYVTHDQDEAMTMADRIVVLRDGRIEQAGPPLTLYDRPANTFVASFIGSPAMNFVPGRIIAENGHSLVEVAGGHRLPAPADATIPAATEVTCGIRPEHLRISDTGLPAIVDLVEPKGSQTQVILHAADMQISLISTERLNYARGAPVRLAVNGVDIHLFAAQTGERLS